MQNKQSHQKISQYEFNSELEMEPSENEDNLHNNNEIRNETINLDINKKDVNIIQSSSFNNQNEINEKSKSENSKKFILIILISFAALILICFAIIFPLVYKNGSSADNEDESLSDVQSLIDNNENSSIIFEANDYLLIDKISKANKVFTQGLFFDTNSTLIESGGLYGKSKLRRFALEKPDLNLIEIPLESQYFAEGACMYLDRFILQLTWKERVM